MKAIGVDLGGTKLAIGLIDEKGQIIRRYEVPTRAKEGSAVVLNQIIEGIEDVMDDQVSGIGVGCPGTVRPADGIVEFAPNLNWYEVKVNRVIEERFGLKVYLENDANAAAWGELWFGAGRGMQDIIYLTVSTGIGGGIIVGGRIYQGKGCRAGEIGHMVVQDYGPLCNCGTRGCLEALASGTSIANRGKEAVARGEQTMMKGDVGAADVAQAARRGDQVAKKILGQAFRYLGMGVANLLNIFDPEVVIIGGGVSKMGEELLVPVKEVLGEFCFFRQEARKRVVISELGSDVGVIGAGRLALK